MAVRWDWSDKLGTATVWNTFREEEVTLTLYRGNCLLIFLYEFTDDDGTEQYQFMNFFDDKPHAKRMLGITKNYDGTKENLLESGCYRYKSFKLDAKRKESKEIAKLLMDGKWTNPITITL